TRTAVPARPGSAGPPGQRRSGVARRVAQAGAVASGLARGPGAPSPAGGWMTTGPSRGTMPTVTVVVPVYNDVQRLRTCVAALLAQDYPAERVEVLVVDNASDVDVSVALPAGETRVRLLHESRRGSYAARNRALTEATGEVLAFTDADCLPRPD